MATSPRKPSLKNISPERRRELVAVCRRLRTSFKRLDLLDLALTHSSYRNESGGQLDNQRLEYLGDSVLGLVINEHLYRSRPAFAEGELARMKSALVSETSLAQVAAGMGIGSALRLGRGEKASGGEKRSSNMADALEAVIAAVYLDRGLDSARRFILRHFQESIQLLSDPARARDPKSRLQELVQRKARTRPIYELVESRGPDHQREFTVRVTIAGKEFGRGNGGSRKLAEQAAAAQALSRAEKEFGRRAP
ncbi:MAG: ribonuclease III [Leptospirales bacterium]|nr:ribonuclease III [Leptospirales bacterium]